jgi:hypothetical protein
LSLNPEVRTMPYAGGCSCGAVRYEIAAEPIRGFQCQCRDCQRDTGSGHASVMVFPRQAVRVTGPVSEFLRATDSGTEKSKGFCGSCGSPLYNKPKSKPDMIGVYVGTLDDPCVFKPQEVIFASRGHGWDYLDPALPRRPNMRP